MGERHIKFISSLRDCGRRFVDAAVPLLESQRDHVHLDLHNPIADEIINGLFARNFRFLQTFVLDYHMWADDVGRSILRMMIETLFYLKFLLKENKPELFSEFRKYGIGQEKLFKVQLRKFMEEGRIKETDELHSYIDSDSDDEISDELVNIKLSHFENLHAIAEKSGLGEYYNLYFQPYSTVVHQGTKCGPCSQRCSPLSLVKETYYVMIVQTPVF